MEKRVVLAIVLCVALMLLYGWLRPPAPPPQPRPPVPAAGPAAEASNGGAAAALPPAEEHPAAEVVLQAPRTSTTLSSAGGGSIVAFDVWACPYHDVGDRGVDGDPGAVTAAVAGRPGTLAVDVVGARPLGLATAHWALDAADGVATATIERDGLRLVKVVRPSSDPVHPWHLDVEVRLENTGAAPDAPRFISVHGPWMPVNRLAIPEDGVVVAEVGDSPEQLLPPSLAEELAQNPDLERGSGAGWRWVGVRCDFHVGALWAPDGFPIGTLVRFDQGRIAPQGSPAATFVTAAPVLRVPFRVPAVGSALSWKFVFYGGPNSRKILGEAGSPYAGLGDAFPNRSFLGLTFRPIANALAWILEKLAGLGIGYGLAVCALTILVRGALFPLSKKSQVSMRIHAQKMSRLKPKLDAIKEKHAKDPRKQQELTMKLMREEKVSILPGGCLLAFLQMPIWISLYATLQTAYEMRHADFLWIDDLTGPDRLFALPFTAGWPVLHGWFNILPLLMVATWMISSWMQPLPDDPQQASTAKMMRWMPLLFGFMLYQTAAGLTLYMTLSALWSIGETWLIRRVWLSKIPLATAPATA